MSKSSAYSTPSPPSPVLAAKAEIDAEAQRPLRPHVPHWKLVTSPSGIEDYVLNHRFAGEGTAESPFIVDFVPDDPRNPMNWPLWKKWAITLVQAVATLSVAFASSAYAGGLREFLEAFQVQTEVIILGISLFVLGFAIGPLFFAPASEIFGRQIVYFITFGAFTAFSAGATGSKNIQTLVILRFLAGTFGSAPLANAGGVIADIHTAKTRGMAGAVFSVAPFLGPAIGPIAGGFLGETKGWRWVIGLTAIFAGALWVVGAVVTPETYAPVLLRKRATALSKKMGRVYISKMDLHGHKTIVQHLKVGMSRPWMLLFKEPIVLITSIYIAINYGTMYMMFAAFPIVFQEDRGWSEGIGGLAFLGIAVGMLAGAAYSVFDNRRYMRVAHSLDGAAPPEARLPPAMVGSVLLPIGLFWFAWTNGTNVHWAASIIGTAFFAAGIIMVFLSLINYLIDSYVVFAASVLAANSVLRSLFGFAFPLFTTYMYQNLGIHWASSIPAFLTVACLPFPFLFYKYGEPIRMRCEFANEAAEVLRRMRTQHPHTHHPAPPAGTAPIEEEEAEREEEEEEEHVLEEIQTAIDEENIDDDYDEAERRSQLSRASRQMTRESARLARRASAAGPPVAA